MDRIPIAENDIRGHIGKPVCAVLRDGSCFYGTISDIKDGHLYLSGSYRGPANVSTKAKKTKNTASKSKQKASTSGYYPGYGYGFGYGSSIAIPLFLLALLFATPFFGFPFFF